MKYRVVLIRTETRTVDVEADTAQDAVEEAMGSGDASIIVSEFKVYDVRPVKA